MENIKQEFAIWLLKNAPSSYKQYLGTTLKAVNARLEEIDHFFPERSVFEVDLNNPTELLDYVHRITSSSERKKNEAFAIYDKKNSNGIPKAILGKNNYLTFLSKYFSKNSNLKIIIANITWNSKDWKEVAVDDSSGHTWVAQGNIPHESWNFDFDNPRNTDKSIKGFAKFTNSPKVDGNNNLVIFYSRDKIVGFYGKAEVLQEKIEINEEESYNLIGDKDYSLVLENKIEAIKDKGFLEDKLRVGQIGFNYLDDVQTAYDLIDEAIRLNPKQADKLNKINEWIESSDSGESNERNFRKRISDSDPTSLNIFFNVLDRLIQDLNISNNYHLVFSTGSNQLSFQIGKRYCLNLKKDKFSFITPDNYEIAGMEKEAFSKPNSAFLYSNTTGEVVLNNYEAILSSTKTELKRDTNHKDKPYDNAVFRKAVFDKEYRKTFFDFTNPLTIYAKPGQMSKSLSLNQILFGPPGTGKTFNTINHALEICGEDISNLSREKIKILFEQKVDEGQIVFTTFHQSMTYEDFIEGIKPIEPEKEGDPVIYRVEEGIFRKLCIEASFAIAKENESEETEQVLDFSLAFDHFVQELEEKLASEEIVELDTKNGGKVMVDSISPQGNIIIKHHGGSRTYTVSKTRISKLQKAITDLDEVNNINDLFREIIGGSNASAYWSVLNALRKRKTVTKTKKTEERKYTYQEKKEVVHSLKKENFTGKNGKPFVLIIDEINRGNISQIFGELITVIEDDKRLGKPESIQLKLPYSKELFGVPPNIHIIGTMNTADRSVEALDTALRRRFSFVEMPPIPELIRTKGRSVDGIVTGIDLSELLILINKRIEKLLDKDHMIGHSYFIEVSDLDSLKMAFQNKIIPLLQEYFFGDFGKIGLVIGNGFFELLDNHVDEDFFAPFDDYDSSAFAERNVYHLKNTYEMDDSTFNDAISILLGKK